MNTNHYIFSYVKYVLELFDTKGLAGPLSIYQCFLGRVTSLDNDKSTVRVFVEMEVSEEYIDKVNDTKFGKTAQHSHLKLLSIFQQFLEFATIPHCVAYDKGALARCYDSALACYAHFSNENIKFYIEQFQRLYAMGYFASDAELMGENKIWQLKEDGSGFKFS